MKKEDKKRIRIIIILIIMGICIFLISGIISSASIDPAIQGQSKMIYQTCNNCTYLNFTRIMNQDNVTLASNIIASQDGTFYYYTLTGAYTTTLGTYTYCYDGGNSVEKSTGCITFEVTPSGKYGTANMVFFLFVILMIYGITFIGFFGRSIPITILGGMAMLFLGIYIINEGLIIYRDNITIYFSYITIALGFIFAILAILEQFDVTLN